MGRDLFTWKYFVGDLLRSHNKYGVVGGSRVGDRSIAHHDHVAHSQRTTESHTGGTITAGEGSNAASIREHLHSTIGQTRRDDTIRGAAGLSTILAQGQVNRVGQSRLQGIIGSATINAGVAGALA